MTLVSQIRNKTSFTTKSFIPAIKQDHREIESYYNRINKSTNKDEQTQYQNLFTWELTRHSIGEEIVIYPALKKYVQEGNILADKDRDEHQSIFQSLISRDTTFLPTFQALMGDLKQHIHEEETSDLPKLEAALSEEKSRDLSKSFGRTKMFMPSKAYSSGPWKPRFETAVGLMTTLIDLLVDLFRQWSHTAGMPNPSTR